MDLKAKTDTLLKEQVELKAKLKEVFQNQALRKDTRWSYYRKYSALNEVIHIGLPSGYYELACKARLEPWQEEFTPPGHITDSLRIVSLWENAGLDTVELKDFFMETAITTMVITDE